jgi:ABC-2 type transport system permease protein
VSTLAQYLALSRRSVLGTIRQPTSVIPSLMFPLLFLALSAAAFDRATQLPGFPPVDSFLQFVVSTTIVQGCLFGSIAAGGDMATDIEGGFFDRLVASPVARTSILVGRVMGAVAFGFVQAWLFFGITTIFGLDVEGGPAGMLLISIVGATLAGGFGAIWVAFALRTGSAEAVRGSFPLLFSLLFLSSAFFPRDLMNGWFQTAADLNPLSHLIEGLRAQVIGGLDLGRFATAWGIALGVFAIGTIASSLALRSRLAAYQT